MNGVGSKGDAVQDYTQAGGAATNANFTGPWLDMSGMASIAFQVVMTGTGSPVGTWGVDVTDDDDPVNAASLGSTPLTLTSSMTAQNPSGNGAAVNYLFVFSPRPDARWIRFKYTAASGGSASKLLQIGAGWRRAERGW
jgi:hypothetical protein